MANKENEGGTVMTQVRMPFAVHKVLRQHAFDENRSLNAEIVLGLTQWAQKITKTKDVAMRKDAEKAK